MNFNDFARIWRAETFMAAAFNEMEELDSFLDSPECGVGNEVYDLFRDELTEAEFPTRISSWEEV